MEPYIKVYLSGLDSPVLIHGAISAFVFDRAYEPGDLRRVRFLAGDTVLADFKYDEVIGWEISSESNGFPIK